LSKPIFRGHPALIKFRGCGKRSVQVKIAKRRGPVKCSPLLFQKSRSRQVRFRESGLAHSHSANAVSGLGSALGRLAAQNRFLLQARIEPPRHWAIDSWSEKVMVWATNSLVRSVRGLSGLPTKATTDDLSEQQFGSVHFPTPANSQKLERKILSAGVALLALFAFRRTPPAELRFGQGCGQDDSPRVQWRTGGIAKERSAAGEPNPQKACSWVGGDQSIAKSLPPRRNAQTDYLARTGCASMAHPEKKGRKKAIAEVPESNGRL